MDKVTTERDIAEKFSWYDYGMFGLMLALSTIIGVYFGFVRKQTTSNDYLLGGKKMSAVPISISLIASVLSGITLLVIPVDVYSYGITYWFSVPMLILTNIITYTVYLPVFYELQVTSTFEYLKFRFDVTVSSFASVVFTISQILYLPIVIYVPALALSQATGININVITPVVCIVCIFYTSFGGLKAVVWTDVLQFTVMISSIIVVFYLGLTSTGGLANIWEKNLKYGRLDVR
ncbi:hypothetical protein AMK59_1454 [Oryctes borbonicus]|uniref:Sodium/solute symporter n=1 Tax=Oryctes borbonicus TaxID=1629725 RepID=A0A0T6BAA5_9SCAR|nr:hypothetical protein AMK59_1454 [Oryctes borbonicus]